MQNKGKKIGIAVAIGLAIGAAIGLILASVLIGAMIALCAIPAIYIWHKWKSEDSESLPRQEAEPPAADDRR